MKIYISGQITGLEKIEYENNFRDAKRFINMAYSAPWDITVSPLDITPFLGNCKRTITVLNYSGEYKVKHWSEFYKENWLNYMINDIRSLRKCTHIAMHPNWIESRGAVIEYFLAKFIFKQKIIWL